jgi:hypothetical protein
MRISQNKPAFPNSAANSLPAPALQPKFRCPLFDEDGLKPRIPNDFPTIAGRIDGKKRVFPCREGNPTEIAVMV